MRVAAIVARRDTVDGVSFLLDEVPIGFAYEADTESIAEDKWVDTRTQHTTGRISITVYGSATNRGVRVGRMPLELFRLEVVR